MGRTSGGQPPVWPGVAGAQTQRLPVSQGNWGTSLAAGSSATGPGTTIFAGQAATGPNGSGSSEPNSFASIVVTGSAGITAGAVALEVTQDGTNWFRPASAQTVGAQANPITAVASTVVGLALNFPCIAARANITTAIATGTITATVALSG